MKTKKEEHVRVRFDSLLKLRADRSEKIKARKK